MGRLRLHANVARFQRLPLNKAKNDKGANDVYKYSVEVPSNSKGFFVGQPSYVGSVKHKMEYKQVIKENTKPSLVLDESCLLQYDYSLALKGKVLIEFRTKEALENFKFHVGVGSWFSSLEYASNSFVIDERVVWVDIEGVPMKVWTNNTFNKISSKWGELLFEEDKENMSLYSKRICIKTKLEQNIFETFKIIIKGKVFWIRAKEVSGWVPEFLEEEEGGINDSDIDAVPETNFSQSHEESKQGNRTRIKEGEIHSDDPFNLYDLLQKKPCSNNKEEENSNATFKYPPGRLSGVQLGGSALRGVINPVRGRPKIAQKVKINWSIEGDENSKYFHGMLNNKRNQHAIRGILTEGIWIEDPNSVKNEFLSHFNERFDSPCSSRLMMDMVFPNRLNKFPRLDGFTFGFYRRYWDTIEKDVVNAVSYFFTVDRLVGVLGDLVNEVESAFIVNRQILDGPFILDELIHWCKYKRKQTMIFKVDFEKAYDSVRWDYLDDVLNKFGFGSKWRDWIHNCLHSSKGSILVNGSPTGEFHFRKGLKQVNEGLFKGVSVSSSLHLSHLFFADDVIFMGQWSESNINTVVQAFDCFYKALGLRMNLHKSKLMGIAVEDELVSRAAIKMRCSTLKTPFSYLGIKVGGSMSRIKSWDEIVDKLHSRLSKWKMKTLSIGGRFPRVYALGFDKKLTVATKMNHNDVGFSLRRLPRDGVKMEQFRSLTSTLEGVVLPDTNDRWFWSFVGSGEFSIDHQLKGAGDAVEQGDEGEDPEACLNTPRNCKWVQKQEMVLLVAAMGGGCFKEECVLLSMERGFLNSGERGVKHKKGVNNFGNVTESGNMVNSSNGADQTSHLDQNISDSGNETQADQSTQLNHNLGASTASDSASQASGFVTSNVGNSLSPAGNAPNSISFVTKVTGNTSQKTVNFRPLFTPARNGVDVHVPKESFGFKEGMEAMLESSPWLIRNVPLILKQWTPDANIMKEDVFNIHVWVKFHDVPITAFTEDGASYARAMIELKADVDLRDTIVVTVPKFSGEGFTTSIINVEYEWAHPRCSECKVFGHFLDDCPKKIVSDKSNNSKMSRQPARGPSVQTANKATTPILNSFYALSTLVDEEEGGGNQTPSTNATRVVANINELEIQMLDGKLVLVDEHDKLLEMNVMNEASTRKPSTSMRDQLVESDEDEVEFSDDETSRYMCSTGGGGLCEDDLDFYEGCL
ncbi:RNA-directed DNA polymerase, eukaryota [Tanacetum coccineum]|uniref:RNA-directed DNA polymerase, eukaryota n=1 Tax=Tanacetum coccineum TaxID=301880 RepID=A0ABQ5E692_9ASTR